MMEKREMNIAENREGKASTICLISYFGPIKQNLYSQTLLNDGPPLRESDATASETVKKRNSGLMNSSSSSALCSFSITSLNGFTNTSCTNIRFRSKTNYNSRVKRRNLVSKINLPRCSSLLWFSLIP